MAPAAQLVAVETRTEPAAVATEPHAFPAKTLAMSPPATATFQLAVPRLADAKEIVVERASLTLRGEVVDLSPVVLQSPARAQAQRLALPGGQVGSLRRVRIVGLSPTLKSSAYLSASDHGRVFKWDVDGSTATFTSGPVDVKLLSLHFVAFPLVGPETYGTPVAAAPLYDQGNAPPGKHLPLLGGATLTLDQPAPGATTGSLTIDYDPPINAADVQIQLVAHDLQHETNPSPFTGTMVLWTATSVTATWATGPRQPQLHISAGGGAKATTIAADPGELRRTIDVDFTPAARAILADLHRNGGSGDLTLSFEATATSVGKLVADGIKIAARYHHAAVPGDGLPISLNGAPRSIVLDLPNGASPSAFSIGLSGRFGSNVLVVAADRGIVQPRRGFQLQGAVWAARRMALTNAERALPIARVGLLGRATGKTEILVAFHNGDEHHVGARIGKPTAIQIAPSPEPAFWRADVKDAAATPPHSSAVWVVARVSRGVFWWYGDPAGPGPCLLSADEGGTWSAVDSSLALQLHVVTEPDVAPLELRRADGSLLAADVLASKVASSRASVQQSLSQAARAGAAAGAAALAPKTTASFQKEGMQLFTPAEVAAAGGRLDLSFDSARDVDFRVLAADLTYDPWRGKGGASS